MEERIVDIRTASREDVEQVLIARRELALKHLLQVQIELDSVNENRFADNPIYLPLDTLDFRSAFADFNRLTREDQNRYLSELWEED